MTNSPGRRLAQDPAAWVLLLSWVMQTGLLFSVEYPGERRIVDDEEQIGSSLPLAGGSARWAALLALLLFVTVAFLVKRTR